MTIEQEYNHFKNQLASIYEGGESETISDWVFEKVTGLKRWDRRNNKEELNITYSKQLKIILDELLLHKPVQYVLNEAWFYKMKFFVNENVLIPRPETEELIEWIVKDVQKLLKANLSIIDIGTGSGCIPISLKKELPQATVTAIDISEKALNVAKKNSIELRAAIDFFQIDFLDSHQWKGLQRYDIVASNPPYIPIAEKEILAKNVTDFEPSIALFVENNDPFIFYKNIARFSESHLKENGCIYVEVHEEYAQNVKSIFESAGYFSSIKKDMYGRERMVKSSKGKV